jgi:hypothetical protein
VNPAQRRSEFAHHFTERRRERGAAPNEHIIMAGV